MRTWMVVGAAALAIAASIQGAEARGRGFGRLFSGRAPTSYEPAAYQPAAAISAAGQRMDHRPMGRISNQPVVAITPGRAGAVAAASAVPVGVGAAELRLSDEATASPPRPPIAALQPVEEVRAKVSACALDRRVGGLGGPEGGFCLIN